MKIPVLVLGKTHKLIINKIKIDSIYLKNVFLLVLQMNNNTSEFAPLKGLSSDNFSQIAGALIANLETALAASTTSCDFKAAQIEEKMDTINEQKATIEGQKATINEQKATIEGQKATIEGQEATIKLLKEKLEKATSN